MALTLNKWMKQHTADEHKILWKLIDSKWEEIGHISPPPDNSLTLTLQKRVSTVVYHQTLLQLHRFGEMMDKDKSFSLQHDHSFFNGHRSTSQPLDEIEYITLPVAPVSGNSLDGSDRLIFTLQYSHLTKKISVHAYVIGIRSRPSGKGYGDDIPKLSNMEIVKRLHKHLSNFKRDWKLYVMSDVMMKAIGDPNTLEDVVVPTF